MKYRYRQAVVDMLEQGKVPLKHALFIDAYNRSVMEIPPTITTRIGSSNNYYVTIYEI